MSNLNSLKDENEYRFIAVLNKKVELGKLFNALGHMTAGLSGSGIVNEDMSFLDYIDGDNKIHKSISHFPFIILKADNSNKVLKLRKKLKECNLPFTDFTTSMSIGTTEEQMNETNRTLEGDLEYIGVCTFARTKDLKPLTKQFSLFK